MKKVITAIIIVIAIVRFGYRCSQNHSRNSHREDPVEVTYRRLTKADMDTVNLWNEKQISILIPKNMRRIKSDSAYMDVEAIYRTSYLDADIFRISIIRQAKLYYIDQNIKDLQSFTSYWQTSDSEKYTYTADTTSIHCLADKNGYSSLYYTVGASDAWGKKVFVDGDYDYYVITAWTHPKYKYKFNNIIDKTLTSFNVEKQLNH